MTAIMLAGPPFVSMLTTLLLQPVSMLAALGVVRNHCAREQKGTSSKNIQELPYPRIKRDLRTTALRAECTLRVEARGNEGESQ
jgi:hypothetical protein